MKNTILSKIFAAAAASALIALTGCGNSENPVTDTSVTETEAPVASADDDSLQKVLDKKQLVLGLDASFPPMGFTDSNGEIIGFDIDVAQEVCNRLNIELVKKPINWDNKEQDLDGGVIDCIWNGMSVNPDRAALMCLSEPYMSNAMIFVVSGDSEIISVDELSGKKVGVQQGSSAMEILEGADLGVEIVTSDDNVSALEEMEKGQTEAVFLDSVVANYLVSTSGKTMMFLPEKLEEEEYAIGFRKEDVSLRNEVQRTLEDMKADGTLGEISTKWFGSDITTVK